MLYCEFGIRGNRAERSTEGEAPPAKDNRSDENGRGSATESACTRASAKRDAEHRSESENPDG